MLKFTKIFMFVLAMATFTAGANAAGKVAVLNIQRAILSTDLAQARLKELRDERDYKTNRKELEQLQKRYQKDVDKLNKELPVLSNEQKAARGQSIQAIRGDMEHVGRKLQAAEQALVQSVIQELGERMQKAIKTVVDKENIGLLLDSKSAIVVADNSFDITSKVTDRINKSK